ncbi:proline racemase family protein [Diplocloster modestus]|uniref:Proline racemase family protein n=1 Tax=Diplocloster modestus TaxID=2850322 RepID=A0ABS6K8L3_9FIRM|nr:proline racemase family protein [Diplocloster modestus]MBU9726806.1 proline racemase family protein [Diplocloster modestus]
MGIFYKTLDIVDTHTCGQATRTIVSGVPRLHGKNMMEKMLDFQANCDWIKSVLTCEPRGNSLTSVAVLTEPTMEDADAGAFYFEAHGYMPLCGHDTIGLCTMLVETGRVAVTEPVTRIKLETPAGLIRVDVEVKDGRAISAAFQNAPCFAFGWDYSVEFEGKKIPFAAAYGGNIYAIVPAKALGVELKAENHGIVVETALRLMDVINEKYGEQMVHPEQPLLKGITHMMVTGEIRDAAHRKEKQILSKNCVCTKPDAFDRSPCGTGTSARTALLYAQGLLRPGMVFRHCSIIDSLFEARIVDEVTVGPYRGVIPEIKGNAHLTGFAKIIVDPTDDKGLGFSL